MLIQKTTDSVCVSSPTKSLSSTHLDDNEQPPIDYVEDVEGTMDDSNVEGEGELFEDDIRKNQKLDFISTISTLRLQPIANSRMKIPLCRLVPMPLVRPTLSCDVTRLEQDFAFGYEDGARVFYVSISNEQGEYGVFTEEEKAEWGHLWNTVNDAFNLHLSSIPELRHLVDKKFYVCDGNHRRIAWMNYIQRKYSEKLRWHVSVDSIILDTKGRIGVAMQLMHDINK